MLPTLPFERMAKKMGIKRISKDAIEEIKDAIEEMSLELSENAVKLSRHAGRRTVMAEDVKFVAKGRN